MADNHQAFVELHAYTDKLRRLVDITEDSAKEISKKFEARTAGNIAAQRDPYGHLWRPAKDGRALLTNAMAAIKFTVAGTTITIEIGGVEAMHQVGSARGYYGGSGAGYQKKQGEANLGKSSLGGFRRAQIPFSKLPGPFEQDIREVLGKKFDQIFARAA